MTSLMRELVKERGRPRIRWLDNLEAWHGL